MKVVKLSNNSNKNKYWTPPRLWEGGTAYIIGGGPSVKEEDLSIIKNKRIIGVNDAYKLGPWVDICWFGDWKWWVWNRKDIKANYKGLVVTCCNSNKMMGDPRAADDTRIKIMKRAGKHGILKAANLIAWNFCSGSSAINFAYHLGVKRIVLIGFDMQRVNGAKNWHDYHHRENFDEGSYLRYLRVYQHIARDARLLDLEIINTSMVSKIDHFPKMSLGDAVRYDSNEITTEYKKVGTL